METRDKSQSQNKREMQEPHGLQIICASFHFRVHFHGFLSPFSLFSLFLQFELAELNWLGRATRFKETVEWDKPKNLKTNNNLKMKYFWTKEQPQKEEIPKLKETIELLRNELQSQTNVLDGLVS